MRICHIWIMWLSYIHFNRRQFRNIKKKKIFFSKISSFQFFSHFHHWNQPSSLTITHLHRLPNILSLYFHFFRIVSVLPVYVSLLVFDSFFQVLFLFLSSKISIHGVVSSKISIVGAGRRVWVSRRLSKMHKLIFRG